MVIKIPPKQRWSQAWSDAEAKEIAKIAESLKGECPRKLDDNSLWLSAEQEYATPGFTKMV